MKQIVLIGTADTAKDIYSFIKDYKLFDVIAFAVDHQYKTEEYCCGLPVYVIEELSEKIDKNEVGIFVPIQWNYLNRQRKEMYWRLKDAGFHFVNVIAPNAVIHSMGSIGENCWIADNVVIESNVTIGNNVFVKSKAWIGHYTTIADHCFIGAASMVAGKVTIGEQSFIGINAMVFDGVKIGRKCLVGACTFVKRSLPDFSSIKLSSALTEILQYNEIDIEEKLVAAKNIR